jgi:hypothetical protein
MDKKIIIKTKSIPISTGLEGLVSLILIYIKQDFLLHFKPILTIDIKLEL